MSENSIVCKEIKMLATNKQTLRSAGWVKKEMFILGDEIFHHYENNSQAHSLLLKTYGGLLVTACGAERLLEDYGLLVADADYVPEYWDEVSISYLN